MTGAIEQARALPSARPDVFMATLVIVEISRMHHLTDEFAMGAPIGDLTCIGCGCTDSRACAGGCSWVSISPPICSSCCADDEDPGEYVEFFR